MLDYNRVAVLEILDTVLQKAESLVGLVGRKMSATRPSTAPALGGSIITHECWHELARLQLEACRSCSHPFVPSRRRTHWMGTNSQGAPRGVIGNMWHDSWQAARVAGRGGVDDKTTRLHNPSV